MGVASHYAEEVRKTALGIDNRDAIVNGLYCGTIAVKSIELAAKARTSGARLEAADLIDSAYSGGAFAIDGTLQNSVHDIDEALEEKKNELNAVIESGSAKLAATLHTGRDELASTYEDGCESLDSRLETGKSWLRSTIQSGEEAMNDTLHDGDKHLARAKKKCILEVNKIPEPAHERLKPIDEKCDTRVALMTLKRIAGTKEEYYSLAFTRADGR